MARRLVKVVRGSRGSSYSAGRDASGRWSRMPVQVRVTARGHWYRSDDPMHETHNDLVCRGCGATGHFDYILDYTACRAPAAPVDIAALLGTTPQAVAS